MPLFEIFLIGNESLNQIVGDKNQERLRSFSLSLCVLGRNYACAKSLLVNLEKLTIWAGLWKNILHKFMVVL